MAAVGREERAGEAAKERMKCRAGERGAPPSRDEGTGEYYTGHYYTIVKW